MCHLYVPRMNLFDELSVRLPSVTNCVMATNMSSTRRKIRKSIYICKKHQRPTIGRIERSNEAVKERYLHH